MFQMSLTTKILFMKYIQILIEYETSAPGFIETSNVPSTALKQ